MKETMTPRERVLKAINHQLPDRVPIDFGGFQTGIHKKAYQNLIRHLGFEEDIVMLDPVQQLSRPSEAVLRRFRVDTRYVCARPAEGFDGRIRQNYRNGKLWHDLKDEFGVVWSMQDYHQLYMDISHHPLAQASQKDLEDYPFPDGSDPTRFAGLRETTLRLRRESNFALCTGIGGVVYEYCWYLRGMQRWFMDMIENPAFCEKLLDCMLIYWINFFSGFLDQIGDLVDVIMIGDDLAGQQGPLFSPKFYRNIVKPRQKKLVQHIKSLSEAKVWYHTCGGCSVYIPELIDNGVDILNPIQISADDMNPETLKREFGDKIVFWGGGIDGQHFLPFALPKEIYDNVRDNLEIFKPRGGYVFNTVHNIQADVSPENIIALFDAAYECGFYEPAPKSKLLEYKSPAEKSKMKY